MKESQINRIFNLIRRTGDKCLIADEKSDEVFALMRLDDYEDLHNNFYGESFEDMSEKEIMDKVERDLSIWRSKHGDEESEGTGVGGAPEIFGFTDVQADKPVEKINLEGDDEDGEGFFGGISAGDSTDLKTAPVVAGGVPEIVSSVSDDALASVEEESLEDLPADPEDENTFLLEPV